LGYLADCGDVWQCLDAGEFYEIDSCDILGAAVRLNPKEEVIYPRSPLVNGASHVDISFALYSLWGLCLSNPIIDLYPALFEGSRCFHGVMGCQPFYHFHPVGDFYRICDLSFRLVSQVPS